MSRVRALPERLYLRFHSRPLYTARFPVLTPQATNAVGTYCGECLRSDFPTLTGFSETEGWTWSGLRVGGGACHPPPPLPAPPPRTKQIHNGRSVIMALWLQAGVSLHAPSFLGPRPPAWTPLELQRQPNLSSPEHPPCFSGGEGDPHPPTHLCSRRCSDLATVCL